ncbi:hypothetical protein A6I89_18755 [Prescottella equi]|uniref:Uncharacterized protein n=1 Tax=Rhodococcus hoagii TaxID=43767 RepID=A0AAE5MHT0_RHOHA|nr:FAD-dependent oxidoreductase [Prescottella equi NBRC 101255 = C 7]ORL25564.1 hypothetical protein A6I89_18755 [Prescottella equi]ORL98687.1 hypothetical protein A5N73_19285 [Prescottella equi]ORM23752.1 hypothetical protein A5N68_18690 [Prescottella equi]SUE05471.1 FAD-dependent oxidoreductase [Prescottella equi]
MLITERMREITVDPVTRVAVTQPGLLNAEVKKAAARSVNKRTRRGPITTRLIYSAGRFMNGRIWNMEGGFR